MKKLLTIVLGSVLILIVIFPQIALWLPNYIYGS